MRKWVFLLLTLPGFDGAFGAEAGFWLTLESVDGRAIRVEVLELFEAEVKVRKASGQEFLVELGRLSRKSQDMVLALKDDERWLKRRFPAAWGRRATREARLASLTERGGDEECERAVTAALWWLMSVQNKDGSWGQKTEVAMTGLALQCLSGRGESLGSEEFGETFSGGVRYLVELGKAQDGRLGSNV